MDREHQRHQRITHPRGPSPNGPPLGEHSQRRVRSMQAQTPSRAIARQTPHVRHQHRIRNPGPLELPVHRPTGPRRSGEGLGRRLVNSVRSPDVDHLPAAVRHARRTTQSGACRRRRVPSCQCNQNGYEATPPDLRIGTQKDQVVPLQPRLVADAPARSGAEVPAREALPALGPTERSHPLRVLETHIPAPSDRRTQTASSMKLSSYVARSGSAYASASSPAPPLATRTPY